MNNWGCQPDRFTSDLSYPLAISDTTNAASCRASFEPEGFIDREESERSGKWYDDDYVDVFQLKPFVGVNSLSTTSRSKRYFATPVPNEVRP